MMSSASQMYYELTGEEIDEWDYSEEEEDYSRDIIINKKKKQVKKQESKTILCEVCEISIPSANYQTHLQSKKHHATLVESRIKQNQSARDKIQGMQPKKLPIDPKTFTEIFEKTMITETVFSYIHPRKLLQLRLVCKCWWKYFEATSNLEKQYFLRNGCYPTYSDNELSRFNFLRLCTKIDVSGISMKRFIHKIQFQMLPNLSILRIDGHSIWRSDTMVLEPFYNAISQIQSSDLKLEFINGDFNYNIIRIYKNILSSIADNRHIKSFTCTSRLKKIVDANILEILAPSTSITTLNIPAYWFNYIKSSFESSGVIQKEERKRKYSYTFNSTSVTSLEIKGDNENKGPTRLKWILRWLIGNKTLQCVKLSKISYGLSTEKIAIGELISELISSKNNIKTLEISDNGKFGGLDLSVLEDNTTLESLNLNYCDLSLLKSSQMTKNQTLRSLYLQKSRLPLNISLMKQLPSGLQKLDLSLLSYSTADGIQIGTFSKANLPSLIHLNIKGNTFQSTKIICEILEAFPGLRELIIFTSSSFLKYENGFENAENSLIEAFNNHIAIRECDIKKWKSPSTLYVATLKTHVNPILKRNSSNIGRKTKAAR